jgi:cysteine-rich repeat protein
MRAHRPSDSPRTIPARRERLARAALAAAWLGLAGCGGSGAPPAGPGASPTPAPGVCGNGALEGGEECDDGNANSGDGCLATCFRPIAWVEGDTHFHGHGCQGELGPAQLAEFVIRRHLDFGSALVWGDGYQDDRPHFTGEDARESAPGHVLHYDLEVSEFAASSVGHLILLGLRSIDFSPNPFQNPRSGVPIVAWARAQGPRGLVGLSHSDHWPADGSFPRDAADCCTPFELPVHAASGDLAFLEGTVRDSRGLFDEASLYLWSLLQDAGARVTLAGASDFPCVHESVDVSRTPRTSAFLDGGSGYEAWLDALRRGRAVAGIGRGEGLNLRVNGARLGDEVGVRAGEPLRLSVEASLAEAGEVQVLANGQGVGRVRLAAGLQAAPLDITLGDSAWLVARSGRSITNPVYVLVDGRPIRSASATCYWMRYLDHLSGLVRQRTLDLGGQTDEALAAYGAARAVFEARHAEAGGGECR